MSRKVRNRAVETPEYDNSEADQIVAHLQCAVPLSAVKSPSDLWSTVKITLGHLYIEGFSKEHGNTSSLHAHKTIGREHDERRDGDYACDSLA